MITLGMQGRKWEIFKSAVGLFAAHGYENVTIRDIGKANGIKSASLYNHFPSKEALLDTMYIFYITNLEDSVEKLENVLKLIPEKPAREVLYSSVGRYEEELQPMMDSIFMLASAQGNRDRNAHDLLWNHHFQRTGLYLKSILERMMELDLIEPLDMDSFAEVFTGFIFSTIYRNQSLHPLGDEGWAKCLDLMFSIVKEKPRSCQGPCAR